jgi:hypothetical protein
MACLQQSACPEWTLLRKVRDLLAGRIQDALGRTERAARYPSITSG